MKRKTRNALIMMIVSSTVALTAGGGVFAWFVGQRSASIDVMSLTLGGDQTRANIKYFSLNKNGSIYSGYKSNDSRVDSETVFSYDSYFLDATESARKSLSYNPGYSFSFAIEIAGGEGTKDLVLTKYTAKASNKFQKTAGGYFSLSEAFNVYTTVYPNKPTSEEIKAYFEAQGIVGEDKFTLTSETGENGVTTNVTFASGISAASSYILMTLYFSNDPSTWYSLDSDQANAQLAGNGVVKTITLENAPKGKPSVVISDRVTSSGSTKNIALSAAPSTISSLSVNGVEKELDVDYTISNNTINFYATPSAGEMIEATYIPYSSEWEIENQTITFKAAPLNGSTTNVSYNYELDTYVADPVNGDSNVFEGLGILLNTLTIS